MDAYSARLVQMRTERDDLVNERGRLKKNAQETEAAQAEVEKSLGAKLVEISLTLQERSDAYHKAKRQKRWDAGEDIDV